jgi:hypothetical protein
MRNSGHRRTKVVEDQVGALIDGIAHRLPGEQFVRNAAPQEARGRARLMSKCGSATLLIPLGGRK